MWQKVISIKGHLNCNNKAQTSEKTYLYSQYEIWEHTLVSNYTMVVKVTRIFQLKLNFTDILKHTLGEDHINAVNMKMFF